MEATKERTSSDLIVLTEAAAQKLTALLKERGLEGYGLRVFVQGGGCAGLQYGMTFENQSVEGDQIIEVNGTRVYIDPISAQYLAGSTIDYVDDLMGGGFRIDNPNAVTSCGCGHSFRTTQSTGGESGCGTCGG